MHEIKGHNQNLFVQQMLKQDIAVPVNIEYLAEPEFKIRGRQFKGWLRSFGSHFFIFYRNHLIFGYVGSNVMVSMILEFQADLVTSGVRNVLLASLEDIKETEHFLIS